MTISPLQVGNQVVVEHEHFQQLLVALGSSGYEVVGPTARDNAIVYDALTSVAYLPVGYTVEGQLPESEAKSWHSSISFVSE